MSGTASTAPDADDVISVGAPLPDLIEATPLAGRLVYIRFASGVEKTVDLAPALASRRIFIPLREDDALFRKMTISPWADALTWPGPDLEFPADWLEDLPPATFSNTEFRDAMDRLGLSLDGMAAALEISRRLVADYRKDKPIPRHIALATRYLVEHAPA
ncbi:DUF2442 domain-containing protein [Segnochrobactraceae bacterium EtOH-i3]